jgi:hypothetical protein
MLKYIRIKEQARLQLLDNPSQINEDNLKNVRRETSRTFARMKREYLKEKKVGELDTNLKMKMNLRRVTNLEIT